MTLLPVVDRELRVAARRPGTYLGRALAALVAVGVFGWLFLIQRGARSDELGMALFVSLSVVAFIFTLFAGMVFSADSVSREKRDGTLGLLFLTDLRGHDVTLGKLAASSLAALYGLVAVLPVLALSLLLGGVTASEYWRVVGVLLVSLFTSLSLGMVASTLAEDARRAGAGAFLLLLALLFLLPVGGASMEWFARRLGWYSDSLGRFQNEWLECGSPIRAITTAYASEYKRHAGDFWKAMIFTGSVGLLGLVLASWRLPRVWQQAGGVSAAAGFSARLARLRFRSDESRRSFRTRLLEAHPVAWLGGRNWLRPWLVWAALLGSGLLYVLLAMLEDGEEWFEGPALFSLSYAFHLLLKGWIASESPRQFFDDRRSGALELLLSTPVTIAGVVGGRLEALRRQFMAPVLAVAGLDLLFMLTAWDSGWDDEAAYWVALWGLHIGTLLLDAAALGWFGAWIGLAATGGRTTFHALLRVLVLPWVGWFLLVTLTAFVVRPAINDSDAALTLLLGSWLAVMASNSLFWWLRARHGLLHRFRELAAGQGRRAGK